MNFLKNEVISEEQVLWAFASFDFDCSKKITRFNDVEYNSVPTSTNLFISDKRETFLVKKYDEICIFCDKYHLSGKCFKANLHYFYLFIKKKVEFWKKIFVLFVLKNHISPSCKAKIKNTNCGRKLLFIMNQNVFNEEGNETLESRKHESGNSVIALTTQDFHSIVFLKTEYSCKGRW